MIWGENMKDIQFYEKQVLITETDEKELNELLTLLDGLEDAEWIEIASQVSPADLRYDKAKEYFSAQQLNKYLPVIQKDGIIISRIIPPAEE